MTNRDFFEKVIAMVEDAEIKDYAEKQIEKLNSKNANRKPTKLQIENEMLREKILDYLVKNDNKIASEIALEFEISPQRASSLMTRLVKDGKVVSGETKSPTGKGKVKIYKLA